MARAYRYNKAEAAEAAGVEAWQVEGWVRDGSIRPPLVAPGTGKRRGYNFLNLVEMAMAHALWRFRMKPAIISRATAEFRDFDSGYSRMWWPTKDDESGLWRAMTPEEEAVADEQRVAADLSRTPEEKKAAEVKWAAEQAEWDAEREKAEHDPSHPMSPESTREWLAQLDRWEAFKNPDTRQPGANWFFYASDTLIADEYAGWHMSEDSSELFAPPHEESVGVVLMMHKIISDLEAATNEHLPASRNMTPKEASE